MTSFAQYSERINKASDVDALDDILTDLAQDWDGLTEDDIGLLHDRVNEKAEELRNQP